MYHTRFKGTHYEMGFHWGSMLKRKGIELIKNVPFTLDEERSAFAKECLPFYERFYPKILEEIKGLADGQKHPVEDFYTVLFSMYCIIPEVHCSCFAFQQDDHYILGRNSDFLTDLEKLYMNCIYTFEGDSYSFNANTTAFIEMEDGINAHGLAIGLTSVYPSILKPGINAGMLLRYGLETCKTTDEFIQKLHHLPIASSQTFTIIDASGTAAMVECNSERIEVQYVSDNKAFVCATNTFHLPLMQPYQIKTTPQESWFAQERYETMQKALKHKDHYDGIAFAKDLLSGKKGFICTYDRTSGKDTVWSVIYDTSNKKIWRVEGNPSRKKFVEDTRFKFISY